MLQAIGQRRYRSQEGRRGKLIAWAEFQDAQAKTGIECDDGTYFSACDQCREMWVERNERGIEGNPPCEDCRVDLMPENADAQRIFYLTRYQLIMGPGGPVDIMHSAVRDAIRDYKIRKPIECFEKVINLARRWWIPKLNERDEEPQ